MKTKYFFLAIAALGLAACTEVDDYSQQNAPVSSLEKGYLAINLKADGATRAEGAFYENGTADEQAVSGATFYFFDAAGNPFNINADGNYYVLPLEDTGNETAPNIESITKKLVVVNGYKGEFPSSIVAVVNYTGTTSLSLTKLRDELTDVGHTSKTNFIMTNSVYADGNDVAIYGTPLTIDNFQTSAEDALDHPVTIHVERMVAKMTVEASADSFDTGSKVGEQSVYAKVLGWEVISNPMASYFIKTIDTTWDNVALGLTWNDAPYFRSYWAGKSLPASNHSFSFNDLVNPINFDPANTQSVAEYLGEYVGAASNERTKYVVAAQLQDAQGKALEIAQWYGVNYVGEQALLAVVAPSLKQKFMQFDGVNTYTDIDDSQLKCVAGNANAESYEVIFQLADGVETNNWYSYDGVNYNPIADPNAELAKVEPAKVWKSGMTYYYADVKHLGAENSATEFGIVRNHSYNISIEGVTGLGTPVYDPAMQVVPVKPIDKETFIAAQINVLSWRVVSQNATLK